MDFPDKKSKILNATTGFANEIRQVELSNLIIDGLTREVRMDGRKINLTDLEFRLLFYLAATPGRVFTYQQIYEAVWGEPYGGEKGNIMTHISHLKAKIESDPSTPRYIENVRGVGYRFKKQ